MSDFVFTLMNDSRHDSTDLPMQMRKIRHVATLLLVGAAWLQTRSAGAADAESCRLQGLAVPDIDTEIRDEAGQAIARLTGTATPLEVKALPVMPSALARIVTSTAEVRGFRIEGWASVRMLGIRAKTRIEVVPSVLALTPGVRLDAVVRVGNDLFVEKRLERDFAQTFVARADCAMLGFADASVYPDPLPPKARIYRLDNASLSLFDAATNAAKSLYTLARHASSDPVLFFAISSEGNWVSLRYDGEVTITAWAKKQDLAALPPGEVQDQLLPARRQRTPPKLAFGGSPQLLRAARSAPLRIQAAASAKPVGELESDAEFYVLEVVSGWASVLPRSLAIMPAPNRLFWVEAKAIGL